MLLVKGSSYSEMKGTVAKDMLHGADREICPQLSILSPFLVPLRSVGTGQGLYQSLLLGAERNEERRENGCNGQNRITTTQTQRVHPQNRNVKKLKV